MLFNLFTAGLACMIPFTTAYTKPVGANPKGNPILEPGLNSLLPAGKSFEVTWTPTTKGTVTLVLLKGPSSDAEPLGVIADGIQNSGMFVWTPSKNLEPSADNQPEGYGIQLIVDSTGQYQYSTQFGISNPSWHQGESWGNLKSMSAKGSESTATASSSASSLTTDVHHTTAEHPSSYGWGSASITSTLTSSSNATVTSSANGTASTGWGGPHNTTMITPTKPMSVPSSLRTHTIPPMTNSSVVHSTPASTSTKSKPTSSSPPQANGASGNVAASFVGLVVAAGAAVWAL